MLWGSAIVAAGHTLGIMGIVAALTTETLTLRQEVTLPEAWRIVIADAVYGLAATTVLVTGILRVMVFGKVAVFAIISLLSFTPTISFLRWIGPLRRQQPPAVAAPQVLRLRQIIRLELILVAMLPLLASMMARGIGRDWFSLGGG
jgi:putative membrane protein